MDLPRSLPKGCLPPMSSSSHSATTAEVLRAQEKICPGDLVVLSGPVGDMGLDGETFWQFVYPGEIPGVNGCYVRAGIKEVFPVLAVCTRPHTFAGELKYLLLPINRQSDGARIEAVGFCWVYQDSEVKVVSRP